MSDTSRGRVTITLGRSGQVVKRDLSVADVSSIATVGIKRSIRDGISNNADNSLGQGDQPGNNKRRQGDVSMQNGVNDVRIGKDDLRLKLVQKNASRQAESNGDKRQMDLREKLSKTVQPPAPSINSRQCMPDRREAGMLRRIPSSRSSDDLTCAESMRSSYSPWALDHIRRRSPDGFPSTSRHISPERNVEDLQRRSLSRTYDSVRSASYVNRDLLETSRPPSTAPESFLAHSTVSTIPSTTAKPVAPHLTRVPPPNTVAQRPSYTGDEQQKIQTVDDLLYSLGLGKYSVLFKAEEVDMTALKQMGEQDLKELGIPMGPRKKILLALLPRAKHQP